MYWIWGVIVGYTFLNIYLLSVSDRECSKTKYVPAKLVCSLAFVIIAIGSGLICGHIEYVLELLPALIMCMLGDVAMALYNQKHQKRYMMAGILLFMGGHIAYLMFLYQIHPKFVVWDVLLPLMAVPAIVLIDVKCRLHLGKLRIPVMLYSMFVSALCAKCVHYMVTIKNATARCMGFGGILFFVSDFLIIFLYFYHFKKKKNKIWVHYFNLLTYYYGVFLFAISVLFI